MAFSFAKLTSAITSVTENETFASASTWLKDTVGGVTGTEAANSTQPKPGAIILPTSESTTVVNRS